MSMDHVSAGIQELLEDPQAVSQLFVSYLALSSDNQRAALAAKHPRIFLPEVLTSLAEAQEEMHQTLSEVREVYSTIDSVADVLALSSFTPVQPAERGAVAGDDLTAQFAARLEEGLSALRDASPASSARHTSALAPIPAAAASPSVPPSSRKVPWHQQAELVLEVLSYLPAKDVLLNAEDVCASWRYWLYVPEVSRFFWIGVVQREFPAFMQQLLLLQANKEDKVLEQDWRSMAMLCVTEEEDNDEWEAEENKEG